MKRGGTISGIAARAGVSETFVKVFVDQLQRGGAAAHANSLCASGLGGCGPDGAVTVEARLHCAACPLLRK
ncbi:hypothetical protein BSR29_05765 [Boudabousia liubingyangii]|uniref:Uncharacterized protein n=2 Tax=Boudabousia liubingyangii TaxID=1921764 RepID=A0A1Q5PLP9_9ACTO|nr:hypothetical protein BSR28_05635 [Boudabousia liubingyangii]OKL47985.1 hypothetical protein BSR29_05765 [Boudabousia liubingyangii]